MDETTDQARCAETIETSGQSPAMGPVEVSFGNNKWYSIAEELLDKADIKINGSRPWDVQVTNPDCFQRVIKEGSLGLGEAYMDGWWDCESLDTFFHHLLRAQLDQQLPKHFRDRLRIVIARILNLQSRKRAWIVGKEHYDLGNDLFTSMLEPYMQYSCGYWKDADTLEEAQVEKLTMICKKLKLEAGMRVLDIGCGWGGFAEFAARRYSVQVTGITISAEQQKHAQQRCEGLDVTILLQDYRDPLDDQFDRIVSVGMFEHVGPKNHAEFFKVINRTLKPDGLFLLHTIGSNKTTKIADPWFNKYIFPNGCLPTIRQIAKVTEKQRFVMEDWHNLCPDYDRTLMEWCRRFIADWPRLESKYGERFKRMFTYYLKACAGAFRARDLQLWQVVFSRGVENGLRIPR